MCSPAWRGREQRQRQPLQAGCPGPWTWSQGGWVPECPNLLGALNKSLPFSEPSFLPVGSGGGSLRQKQGLACCTQWMIKKTKQNNRGT